MAINKIRSEAQKVTITLPAAVLARLNELVPARQRSRFIAEALEERLALAEQARALDETAGAWLAENHPDMGNGAAIDRWLDALRQSWTSPGEPERG
jgi:predicted transcriptional regulator